MDVFFLGLQKEKENQKLKNPSTQGMSPNKDEDEISSSAILVYTF